MENSNDKKFQKKERQLENLENLVRFGAYLVYNCGCILYYFNRYDKGCLARLYDRNSRSNHYSYEFWNNRLKGTKSTESVALWNPVYQR